MFIVFEEKKLTSHALQKQVWMVEYLEFSHQIRKDRPYAWKYDKYILTFRFTSKYC